MAVGQGFLSSFAATVAGTGLVAELDPLCHAAAEGLRADGVGITFDLRSTMRLTVGASNDTVRELARLELSVGEGPGTQASRTGQPVGVADLADPEENRWPMFRRRAGRLTVRAVIALPLSVGSLDLHSDRPHGLDDLDPAGLATVAAMVTIAIANLRLPFGPTTPPIAAGWNEVNRATAMVAAALTIRPLDALDLLRARAFRLDTDLTDLAAAVVAGDQRPDLGDDPPAPNRRHR